MESNQFLNWKKIHSHYYSGIIRTAIGCFWLYMLSGSTNYDPVAKRISLPVLTIISTVLLNFLLKAAILAPGILLVISGIQRLYYAELAKSYGMAFAQDKDGYLLYSDLSQRLRISTKRISVDVRELLRRNYFRNVLCSDGDPGYILLTDDADRQWHDACYCWEQMVNKEAKDATSGIIYGTIFAFAFTMGFLGSARRRDSETFRYSEWKCNV